MANAMDHLEQQLANLSQRGTDLGEEMRQAASQLQSAGEIPKLSLVENMRSYRDLIEELRSQLFDEFQDEDLQSEECTLDLLRSSYEKFSVRSQAFDVLKSIPLLRHRDDADYIPLQECKTVATIMQENIEKRTGGDLPADLQSLITGTHPLCALLELVKAADDLDDETWSLHNETLTTAFGRQLATAVARGKLELSEPDETTETLADAVTDRKKNKLNTEEKDKHSSQVEA